MDLIQDSEIFLIRMDISPKNDVKVYLDGDQGLPINAISRINRSLYQKIEEAGLFEDGNFSLEVSSPGVDEPLVFTRQYHKHLGRSLEVTLEEQTLVGKLLQIEEDGIVIEEVIDKKKKETTQHNIPFNLIKKAIVQISF
ncbi:MAG: ribosome maturation factor [Taibaiella sp.]|nr:ribosome maturation factor [Taibaiella sp.]